MCADAMLQDPPVWLARSRAPAIRSANAGSGITSINHEMPDADGDRGSDGELELTPSLAWTPCDPAAQSRDRGEGADDLAAHQRVWSRAYERITTVAGSGEGS